MRRTYWAAEPDVEDLVKRADSFVEKWKRATGMDSQGIASTWARNVMAYYSTVLEPESWESSLKYTGEQGELVKMSVPQARSLARQTICLVSKQRFSFQAVAGQGATDADTLRAVRLGAGLAEYVTEAQHLDIKGEVAAEHVYVLGAGFLKYSWRTDKGYPYTVNPDDMSLKYTGDVEVSVPTVYDVVYDTNKRFFEDLDWVIVRTTKNRWDLIAQHPELEEEIVKLPNAFDSAGDSCAFFISGSDDEDTVYVWEFYHVPSPSLPEGRMTMFANPKCVFFDGPNLYECLPVEMIRAEPIMGTGFGYPGLSNLLPAQEMLDHCLSAIATNQAATAVQSYIAPRGCELSAVDISGMNFLLYTPQSASGGGKPEPLQLTQSAPETFKFAEILHQHMEQISNINGALRGTPPPGVTAGKSINALTMNSVEFLDSFRKQYAFAFERLMTKIVSCYQKFATVPMAIEILGPNAKSQLVEFIGKDLSPIKRMRIKVQSAVLSTIGGRTDVADTLMNAQMLKSPQQYINIVEGAPLEELIQNELSENDLLQKEREMLLQGLEPPINQFHNHPSHIRDHANLFNDALVSGNPQLAQLVEKHIQMHAALEQQMDPVMKAMARTGMAPQPPAPAPMGPPGMPPPGMMPHPPMGGPPPGPPHGHPGAPPGPHGPQQGHLHALKPSTPAPLAAAAPPDGEPLVDINQKGRA